MQTLEERDTYTPPNASQVRCNCDPALNREETLSVLGLRTSSNPPMRTYRFQKFRDRTCEFLSQKLLSIDNEYDCRFVNPVYANARGTIHPPDKSGGLLYPLTPRYKECCEAGLVYP